MIRFIDLHHQICDDEETSEFTWYDTTISEFLKFNEQNIWFSWADFEEDFKSDPKGYLLERFQSLYGMEDKKK